MAGPTSKEVKKILSKYEAALAKKIATSPMESPIGGGPTFSREYEIFRSEALATAPTIYEKLCKKAEKIIKIKPSAKDEKELRKAIDICHLDVTPNGAASFATLFGILIVLAGILIGVVSFLLGNLIFLLPLFLILAGLLLIKPISRYPLRLANKWRLEASNQMVLCILYCVMYMRHTSNLEHAIKFAGEHIGAPLSLDLRKIFWDVEIGKYFTIKESLDHYLESWRDWNLEFIEAFHLIESSLYEPSENKRIETLEKSLQVMLEGTYEKMLKYAHELKTPITMLHMLGIILPILGLVIFPLLGSFMGGLVKWWHLAILYNVLLPIFVIVLGNNILAKRPTGYGESELLRTFPEFQKYQYILVGRNQVPISPMFIAILIGAIFVLAGLTPLFVHAFNPGYDVDMLGGKFLDYKNGNGPYGIGALLFSLLIPLGLALAIGIYYKLKTRKLIEIKKRTDDLEKEFSGGLFQLGNRIGDGLPTELAFGKVAESMKGTPTGDFFRAVSANIRKLGMSVKNAIFNEKRGAILYFPSSLIESSMKVLVESARKGPAVVSRCLMTFSEYVNRIKKINERLKDLLADIISSMKSQISFLTPAIAGIVVGVASMVVTIINKLGEQFAQVSVEEGAEIGGLSGISSILNIQEVIPSFHFQLIVGIYVIEVGIILIILANGIERGVDKLNRDYNIGRSLILSAGLYFIITLIGILIFNALANMVSVVTAAG